MTEDEILTTLKQLEKDPTMVTNSAYRANSALFPENTISFVETHLAYLKLHPKLDASQYLSNLRLMIRKR